MQIFIISLFILSMVALAISIFLFVLAIRVNKENCDKLKQHDNFLRELAATQINTNNLVKSSALMQAQYAKILSEHIKAEKFEVDLHGGLN